MPDRPRIAFGDLNPVEEPEIGKFYNTDSTSAMQSMREAARNIYKKDALANNGAFKGVVLRVEESLSGHEPGSWIESIFVGLKPPLLRSLKVRIPEIHAMLPDPARYGPNAGSANKIIDMYPTFIALTEEISNQPVAPGDIVLVDFGNRENLTHPQYLGRVYETTLPGAVGANLNQEISKEAKKATLNMEPPKGDEIGGEKDPNNQLASEKEKKNSSDNFAKDDVDETEHTEQSKYSLPPMGLLEEAFRNGQSIGFIELIEMSVPDQATKEGVFIAKFMLEPWIQMVNAAKKDGIFLKLNSGFRSFAQQEYLYSGWRNGISGFNKAAKPGFSNHQNGIAFDIAETENGQSQIYLWLAKHAHKFGFINDGRFFKEQKESWHWSYLGKEHSKVLAESKISPEQKRKSFIT